MGDEQAYRVIAKHTFVAWKSHYSADPPEEYVVFANNKEEAEEIAQRFFKCPRYRLNVLRLDATDNERMFRLV